MTEYHALLNSADVVLCPYSRARYQTTSGPFTEALAAGKPVLVTADTWMSDQLRQYGAGVVCGDQTPESIMEAILRLKQEYPALARQAADRRERWCAVNNPLSFVNALLRVAGDPA